MSKIIMPPIHPGRVLQVEFMEPFDIKVTAMPKP